MEGILILLAGLFLLVPLPTVSQTNVQSTLHLQERCAEGARKHFYEHIEEGRLNNNNVSLFFTDDIKSIMEYTSHYNKKGDMCFIRIDQRSSPRSSRKDTRPIALSHSIGLFNVFEEGKKYADFFKTSDEKTSRIIQFDCTVGNMACKSLQEFEALIKPYMEE